MKRFMLYFTGIAIAAMTLSCNGEAAKTKDQKPAEDSTAANDSPKPEEEGPKGYAIGEAVEDFKLKNVDGKMISMSDYKDAKGFVVIFTCNHCPFSIAYEDRFIAYQKEYEAKGYPIVAINPNDPSLDAAKEDSYELMQERAKEKKFNFVYLFDEGQNVFPKFAATKTPDCFIVQKTEDGMKLAYKGAFDDSKEEAEVKTTYVKNAVEALIAGKTPEVTETLAVGCSIKCSDKTKLKPKKKKS